MASDLNLLDTLSSNLYQLKILKTIDEKCNLLLETLRKTGWRKASLGFLNSKYETKKTLYSGYEPEAIQYSEDHKLPPEKRKALLSSAVERWRIIPFYYLPWKDERVRYILTDGLKTEIPLQHKPEWHKNDLLYAPIYFEGRPIAVLNLDEPKDPSIPSKVNLRAPTIIHSFITEVILQTVCEEHYENFLQIHRSIIARGTIGIIELDETGKIVDVNDVAEQILKISKVKLLDNKYNKVLNIEFLDQIAPAFQEAMKTLKDVNLNVDFCDINNEKHMLEVHLTPLHLLYDYTGMVLSFNYLEKTEIFATYRTVLDNLNALTSHLSGDYINIQNQLIQLMCAQYRFIFPRLYILSEDREILKCVLSYDPALENLSFFDHPFNRNSLAANAILEDMLVYTTEKEKNVRDLRRIWERLKTKAAVAIPLHIMTEIKAALVFDIESADFFLDESKKITLDLFGKLISLALRPIFEKSTPENQ
ncbi:MAG: PAS domain-containing protein [Candidatus Marinimicrobia bacterium]|nr:PAS domain-containing protein [Candidatus Neomarinimicrobiota bacterium]